MNAPSSQQAELPQNFGRFRLVKKIGEGGMAEIFLAEAPLHGGGTHTCVIKRMLDALQGQAEYADMFLTEADVCKFLRHPNLIEVYEAGEISGRYYMAMEYAKGLELTQVTALLRAHRIACPVELAAMIGLRLAKALDYLHRATSLAGTPLELVHRDVNPTNIYLFDDGEVKLGDLGVARISFLEASGEVDAPIKGKLRYLAPELLLKEPADARLDIYDVGVTLFELVTNTLAFALGDEQKTMNAIVNDGIPKVAKLRPEIPKAFAAIIERAAHVDRDKRHESAAAFYRELKGFVEQAHLHYAEPQLAVFMEYLHELQARAESAAPGQEKPAPKPAKTPAKAKRAGAATPAQLEMAFDDKAPRAETRAAPASRTALWMIIGFAAVLVALVTWGAATRNSRKTPAPAPVPQVTATLTAPAEPAEPPTKAEPIPAAPEPETPKAKVEVPAKAPAVSPKDIEAAFALLRQGKTNQAAAKFSQIVRQDPSRTDAHYGLARAYLDLGKKNEALEEARAALKDRTQDPEAWLMLGAAAQETGHVNLARQAFERALRLNPQHPRAGEIRAVLNNLQKTK